MLSNLLAIWLSPLSHLSGRHFNSLLTSNDSSSDATETLPPIFLETTKSTWGISADNYVDSILMSADSSAYAKEICCQIYLFMAKSTVVSQWFPTPIFCRRLMVVAPIVRRYYHLSSLKWPSQHRASQWCSTPIL